jgi:hypothetical protein
MTQIVIPDAATADDPAAAAGTLSGVEHDHRAGSTRPHGDPR